MQGFFDFSLALGTTYLQIFKGLQPLKPIALSLGVAFVPVLVLAVVDGFLLLFLLLF